MNFMELLRALEHRLGNQHLPLNPRATTIKQIFDCSPVHHELMQRVVQALYHVNGCQHLTDPIAQQACFDAIGPVRQDTLKTPSTDVDAYHLLDDLCHALDEIFGRAAADTDKAPAETKRSADVIPLDVARRRKVL